MSLSDRRISVSHMTSSRRLPDVVLPLISLIALLAFFGFKLVAFDRLHYFGDIFGSVHVAKGFADGYPLLHDNDFGDHKGSHNFYIVPLFFPLVRFFGANGLFIVQLLAHLALLIVFYQLIKRTTESSVLWGVWLIFVVSPIGFWLWDNAPYGWHAQLLFLPLCFAMAAGFLYSRKVLIVSSALLLLTYEQGAILCWALHFSWLVIRSDFEKRPIPWKRLVVISMSWALVFTLGLLLQKYFHQGEESRLAGSIARLEVVTRPPVREHFVASVTDCLVLLGSGAVLLIVLGRSKATAAALFTIGVLFIPGTIAAMPYAPWWPELRNHAFAWPPRFIAMWSVLAGITLLMAWHGRGGRTAIRAWLTSVLVVLSFALQLSALEWRRGYSVSKRVAHVLAGSTNRVTPHERRVLECLSSRIPRASEILSPPYLFAIFHHHYVWRKEHSPPRRTRPDLIVLDLKGRSSYDPTEMKRLRAVLDASGYDQFRVGHLLIGRASAPDTTLGCLDGSIDPSRPSVEER